MQSKEIETTFAYDTYYYSSFYQSSNGQADSKPKIHRRFIDGESKRFFGEFSFRIFRCSKAPIAARTWRCLARGSEKR